MTWFKSLKTFYIEKETTPEEVYIHGFKEGFNKAWDMMLPVMSDGMEKLKKSIKDRAISETLDNLNGNHKKNN